MAILTVRPLGTTDYFSCWEAMRRFTRQRTAETADEIWLTEHPPVYTLGLKGLRQHLLDPATSIPVIQTDRGGQITYHGPGQLILYPLLDLKRMGLKVRQLISGLENSVIQLLAQFGIEGHAQKDAPGVYVEGRKIASLGIKVTRQGCYHGIALNVAMDLSPFQAINPCGLNGMEMTQLSALLSSDRALPSLPRLHQVWLEHFLATLPVMPSSLQTDRRLPFHSVQPTASFNADRETG